MPKRVLLLLALAGLAGACARDGEAWARDLDSPDPFARGLAAIALSEVAPARVDPAVDVLLETVDRAEVGLQAPAATALQRFAVLGPDAALERMIAAWATDEWMTLERRAAIRAAVVAAGERGARVLVALLRGSSATPRAEVGALLNEIGPPAVPALVELLGEPDAELARLAASLLGALGPRAAGAAPALEAAASSSDPALGGAAREALRRMGR